MAELINLHAVRKRKSRAEKEKLAEQNRITFGRTKHEKKLNKAENLRADLQLDGHKKPD